MPLRPRRDSLESVLGRVLLVTLALVFVPSALANQARVEGTIPTKGVFVPGVTLAGVSLGMTSTQVKQHWGPLYTLCTGSKYCTKAKPVWLFEYTHGEPLGVAAKFDITGKTIAVFTLGAIAGWHTSEGLKMGDPISAIYSVYPQATLETKCIGFDALSFKRGKITTSFYTASGIVYGFAMTTVTEPICQ